MFCNKKSGYSILKHWRLWNKLFSFFVFPGKGICCLFILRTPCLSKHKAAKILIHMIGNWNDLWNHTGTTRCHYLVTSQEGLRQVYDGKH